MNFKKNILSLFILVIAGISASAQPTEGTRINQLLDTDCGSFSTLKFREVNDLY